MTAMASPELAEVMESTEHLLWVIARCDVENLAPPRLSLLRQLRDVEARSVQLGVTDLYGEVLRRQVQRRLQSSYDEA